MLKSSLVVPGEKLLKKLQCSNGNGGPSRVCSSQQHGGGGNGDSSSEVSEAINQSS